MPPKGEQRDDLCHELYDEQRDQQDHGCLSKSHDETQYHFGAVYNSALPALYFLDSI